MLRATRAAAARAAARQRRPRVGGRSARGAGRAGRCAGVPAVRASGRSRSSASPGCPVAVDGRRGRTGAWLGLLYGAGLLRPAAALDRRPTSARCPGCCWRSPRRWSWPALGAVLPLVAAAARLAPVVDRRAPGCSRRRVRDRLPFGGFPWGRLGVQPGRVAAALVRRARRRAAGHASRWRWPAPLLAAVRAVAAAARPRALVAGGRPSLVACRCSAPVLRWPLRPGTGRRPHADASRVVQGRRARPRAGVRGPRAGRCSTTTWRRRCGWPPRSRPARRRSRTWCSGRRTPRTSTRTDNPDAARRDRAGRATRSACRSWSARSWTARARTTRNAGIVWSPTTGPGAHVRQAAPGAVRRVHPAARPGRAGQLGKVDLVTAGHGRRAPATGCSRGGAGPDRRRHLLRGRLRRPGALLGRRPARSCSSSRPTTPPSGTPPRPTSSWR